MLTNTTMTIAFDDARSDGMRAPQPILLAQSALARASELSKARDRDIVYLIDGDPAGRRAMRDLCDEIGYEVETFSDLPTFLSGRRPGERRCLLVDIALLGTQGFDFIERIRDEDDCLPCIVMSADPSCPMVVQAMRAGAFDFIHKPVSRELFAATLERAFDEADRLLKASTLRRTAAARVATLTRRQHEIMDLVIAGHPSKNIAADLGISQRTVENHRASIGRKTRSKSLSALIHTAIYAGSRTSSSGDGLGFAA
jgi:two-component system, chemotaxis family, CheB/CheR fusion protein